jgi:hypothetical protein
MMNKRPLLPLLLQDGYTFCHNDPLRYLQDSYRPARAWMNSCGSYLNLLLIKEMGLHAGHVV